MKIFHKKFLNQEEQYRETIEDISTQNKTKVGYFLNQFLIWGLIIAIVFLITKFCFMNPT